MDLCNGVMFQSFDWYGAADGSFYRNLQNRAEELQGLGITGVWLPPPYKATSVQDVGYGVYDLFDLGEFDQKGTVRTKYGTREEFLSCVRALQEHGMEVYADVVLNHKAGADCTEVCEAIPVHPDNRLEEQGEAREIEAWTGFHFPGRKGKYSSFQWHWYHFTGVDYDQRTGQKAVFRLCGNGKDWADAVSDENGNFDYLMFADIDYSHPEVVQHVQEWADWFIRESGVDGFRMDAVKHIDAEFLQGFVAELQRRLGKRRNFYVFGEYWMPNPEDSNQFLYQTEYGMDLFDVGLHFSFYEASHQGEAYDLRQLFDRALVSTHPMQAVTFVDNHDTQPGQALTSWVAPWFKAMAYACILLRKDGYPCVFAADLDGMQGPEPDAGQGETLRKLLHLRQTVAFGDQSDYFDDPHCVGFVRHGLESESGERKKLVVVFSNSSSSEGTDSQHTLRMDLGVDQVGRVYRDAFLVQPALRVTVQEDGWAEFPVPNANLSCFVEESVYDSLVQKS